MRLSDKPFVPIVGLVLITVVGGGLAAYLVPSFRRPAPSATALVASVDRAKGAATADSGRLVAARAVTDGTTAAVRQTLTLYDTVRKPLILFPRTADDTARALAQLPRFALTADKLAATCAADTVAHAQERTTARQLDSSRVRTIAALDSLVVVLQRKPRFSGTVEGLVDPFTPVPTIGAAVSVRGRVVGDWSVGARLDYWPGASVRRVVVSHPLF